MNFHRPVFMLLIFTAFFLTGLTFPQRNVASKPISIVATITPTIDKQFKLPASGEPVILSPGNNARLVSPIKMKFVSQPGANGVIRIDLIGHDNRYIFRKIMDYSAYQGKPLLLEEEIPFEVRADEKARLQVVLENIKGKPIHLTSVELILLQVRGTETDGEPAVYPRIIIDQPSSGITINSDNIEIRGKIKPVNNTPLVFEAMTKDWNTLTSRMITVNIPADQTAYSTFDVKLANVADGETPVTLRIRQESDNSINGTVFLWSEDLTLVPQY